MAHRGRGGTATFEECTATQGSRSVTGCRFNRGYEDNDSKVEYDRFTGVLYGEQGFYEMLNCVHSLCVWARRFSG